MSVIQSEKKKRKYYPEYEPVIHPAEVATRKHWGNGDSHGAYLSSCESLAVLPFDNFKRILVFINLPSQYSFLRISDKTGIGTAIRLLRGVSKKFGEWYQKTNKTEDTNKLTLFAFKIIAILHNTLLATFIKLLETVSKGLCRNRLQNRSHIQKRRSQLGFVTYLLNCPRKISPPSSKTNPTHLNC
jgi:hypothetical protein